MIQDEFRVVYDVAAIGVPYNLEDLFERIRKQKRKKMMHIT